MELNWIVYSLVSALFIGFYDIFKKLSVHGNAVIPVLFISVLISSIVWFVPTLLSHAGLLNAGLFFVEEFGLRAHLELFGKAVLVGSSWILAYFSLKHLPVSIVGPIRYTSPLWTLLGAVLLLGERPSLLQWSGILLTLVFFILLSFAGRREGLHFHRNKWIYAIIGATLLGASSSLYDKYLLGIRGYSPAYVQAWFSHYLLLFFLPFFIGWKKRLWNRGLFYWRWSIPLIAFTLLLGDYLYFVALSDPEAMVSVISSLRRAAVVIPFAAGYYLFRESNFIYKTPCLLGILCGIFLIVLGSD